MITIVNFDSQYAPVISEIRNAVFTVEQHIDVDKDQDGEDPQALHALLKEDGKYIGTGRMLADGHIGRLAIFKSYRSRKLGTKILFAFIEEAEKNNLHSVYLGAQVHAIDFYQKAGFVEYGERYLEVGIEHVYMRYNLSCGSHTHTHTTYY